MWILLVVSIILVAKVYAQTTSATVQYPFEISFKNTTQLKFSAVYYDRFITVTCEHFECDSNGLSLTYNFVTEIDTATTTFINIGFTLSGTSLGTADTITTKTTELSTLRTNINDYTPELPTAVSIVGKTSPSCSDGQTLSFYHDFTVCIELCSITEKYNSNDNTCTNFNDILYTPAPTMAASVTIYMPDNYVKLCYAYGAGLSAFLTFFFPFCFARIKDCNKARKEYQKKQKKKAKKAKKKAKKKAVKAAEKKKNKAKNKSEINADKFVYNDNDNEKGNENENSNKDKDGSNNSNENSNDKNDSDDPSIELENVNVVTNGEETNKNKDDKKKIKEIPKQSILSATQVVIENNKKKEEESSTPSESDDDDETNESTVLTETNQ